MKNVDISGNRFGLLVAIQRVATKNSRYWLCSCDCGKTVQKRKDHLLLGRVISCGCYRGKNSSVRMKTHGMSKTRVYRIWRNMINRCHYDKYHERHLYGGRGISVCDKWRESFEAFVSDMGVPDKNLSIDRIDPNGNYEPGNCRWATAKEQANNKRNSCLINQIGV